MSEEARASSIFKSPTSRGEPSLLARQIASTRESGEFCADVVGSTGNRYTVRQSESGGYTCTCKAYEFGRGRECKHIRLVKGEVQKGGQCAAD